MPEDSREPSEIEEQKRFESHVDKSKKRTKSVSCRTPKDLANFIMSNDPAHVYLDGLAIRRIYPNLRVSPKRINELMATDEFKKQVDELLPDVTKQKASGMFTAVLMRYFESQLKLPRGPDAKAITIFGEISGKYSPLQKVGIYDGQKLDAEREKEYRDEAVRALENAFRRKEQEKLDKEGKSGE